MFKRLTYFGVAEILLVLLNDDHLPDMQSVKECFEILIQQTKTPTYRFKTQEAFLSEYSNSLYKLYGSAEDYFYDAINSRKISIQRLESILETSLSQHE